MNFNSNIRVLILVSISMSALSCLKTRSPLVNDTTSPTVNSGGQQTTTNQFNNGGGGTSNATGGSSKPTSITGSYVPTINGSTPTSSTPTTTYNPSSTAGNMSPTTGDSNDPAHQAIDLLNSMRQAKGLPTVQFSAGLSQRCYNWAVKMSSSGLNHDSSVFGTDERENIAGGGDSITPQESMEMWDQSPPHANSMYDRAGFPTAYKAGYGQYQGYSALRICPQDHDSRVCNE